MSSTGDRILTRVAAGLVALVVIVVFVVVGIIAVIGVGAQETTPSVVVREIAMVHQDLDEIEVPPIVGSLEPETVLVIRASGFPGNTTGTASQCATDTGRRCTNRLSVHFDHLGSATFQYLVSDDVGGEGKCGLASTTRCTIELTAGPDRVVLDTVFVDDAPPLGRLEVTPRHLLEIGSTVMVTATGFPAEIGFTLQVCAIPATRGDRCGAPGPVIDLVTDANGTAETELILTVTEVGVDRIACGRRTPCQVVLESDVIGVRARPVRLTFADTSGANYDTGRLAAGLLLAALLGAVSVGVFRSVDWRPPSEADASAIDDAEFADLDAEADLFDEANR